MRPEQTGEALSRAAEAIRAASAVDAMPIVRAAREAAAATRIAASRAGDSVGVRVIERSNGVRVTVTGRKAVKYRALLQQMLDSHLPGARAEIRAQITQKVR